MAANSYKSIQLRNGYELFVADAADTIHTGCGNSSGSTFDCACHLAISKPDGERVEDQDLPLQDNYNKAISFRQFEGIKILNTTAWVQGLFDDAIVYANGITTNERNGLRVEPQLKIVSLGDVIANGDFQLGSRSAFLLAGNLKAKGHVRFEILAKMQTIGNIDAKSGITLEPSSQLKSNGVVKFALDFELAGLLMADTLQGEDKTFDGKTHIYGRSTLRLLDGFAVEVQQFRLEQLAVGSNNQGKSIAELAAQIAVSNPNSSQYENAAAAAKKMLTSMNIESIGRPLPPRYNISTQTDLTEKPANSRHLGPG